LDKDSVLSSMVSELRRGTLVLCVLSQLKTPMYGYSLVNTLNEKGIAAEANTLYPLLRRLESQGLLESSWQTDGPKPRKYYQTTEFGNEICQQLKQHWDKTVNSINQIFEEEEK
jgi:PadR family transcriptional regulator, regulatory protein PadR